MVGCALDSPGASSRWLLRCSGWEGRSEDGRVACEECFARNSGGSVSARGKGRACLTPPRAPPATRSRHRNPASPRHVRIGPGAIASLCALLIRCMELQLSRISMPISVNVRAMEAAAAQRGLNAGRLQGGKAGAGGTLKRARDKQQKAAAIQVTKETKREAMSQGRPYVQRVVGQAVYVVG